MIVLLLVALVAGLATALGLTLRDRATLAREVIRQEDLEPATDYPPVVFCRPVIVNLKTSGAIQGVLLEERGPLLVLGDATFIAEGPSDVGALEIPGQALIARENVAWVQAPPAPTTSEV